MGDSYKTLRLAAVQAASVFVDREASLEKACALIREAGKNGADVIGFPEGFIPSHPTWCNYLAPSDPRAIRLNTLLFNNSVEVPGPVTDRLSRACRDANVIAVIGICEKRPRTMGTMWNTQLFIDRTGELLGKRQKLMPTTGERIVHTGGRDFPRPAQTHFGALSALMCGENSNPLAVSALLPDYPLVHVASWPAHFGAAHRMQDSIMASTCGLAYQMRAFVINACAIVTDEMIDAYGVTEEGRAALVRAKGEGAASIIGHRGKPIAGPLGPGEGILYCDVDLGELVTARLPQDFAGHYNRPDIFSLVVREQAGGTVRLAHDGTSLLGPLPADERGEARQIERQRYLGAPQPSEPDERTE